ncbi:hypothetical protein SM007_32550 [Streptomyces avermitilis]|uniref:Uncharacterized protein n=1 Tax=Streptomyces avermitilis TaxID=33903 RepID=A0A4D4MGM1_STRAX|nr:hypothetical protein SM007_32550 [Streptomyces avermitilis]GDY68435.1 hypothetical protein SAV14893_078280 [Streptomyces avermitilis]GDY71192.1 hypothetical protein SAV31267_006770 [Streptomyces avermitilis]
MDSTLLPFRGRKVCALSPNYLFSAAVRGVVDADTHVVMATTRPGRPRQRPWSAHQTGEAGFAVVDRPQDGFGAEDVDEVGQ